MVNTTALTYTDTGSVTPTGTWPNEIGSAFTTLKTPMVMNDPLSGWDAVNNQYKLPQNGIYLITTKLRFADSSTAAASYSLAANGSLDGGNEDGSFNQWFQTLSSRNGALNIRQAQFSQGDLMAMYAYSSSNLYYYEAEMDIYLLEPL
jgi:hypothetical protein